jgi:hypothetical protein
MSGAYVRSYYRVPAHRGGRVTIDGRPGVITGFTTQYLRVQFDGETEPVSAHPAWRVTYHDQGGN